MKSFEYIGAGRHRMVFPATSASIDTLVFVNVERDNKVIFVSQGRGREVLLSIETMQAIIAWAESETTNKQIALPDKLSPDPNYVFNKNGLCVKKRESR